MQYGRRGGVGAEQPAASACARLPPGSAGTHQPSAEVARKGSIGLLTHCPRTSVGQLALGAKESRLAV